MPTGTETIQAPPMRLTALARSSTAGFGSKAARSATSTVSPTDRASFRRSSTGASPTKTASRTAATTTAIRTSVRSIADMTSRFDIAANVATVIAATGGVATLAVNAWHPAGSPKRAQLRVGGPAPALVGVNFTRATKTLVMFIRHDCQPCADSMPFYRQLQAPGPTRGNATLPRQLVAVALDDPQTAREYVKANGLRVNALIAYARDKQEKLGIAGTPALVLVDNTVTVQKIWL